MSVMFSLSLPSGVFGIVYDGYLSNAEDEPEGTTPVIIKTVKGRTTDMHKQQIATVHMYSEATISQCVRKLWEWLVLPMLNLAIYV